MCSFLYPINPWQFIDHGSIIKHIIQDPLEILGAFYKLPWTLDQVLNVYRLPVVLFFSLGILSKIYGMGTTRFAHILVPFGFLVNRYYFQ